MDLSLKPLIVCGTQTTHSCQFSDLITLVNVGIFDLTILATILTVVACILTGFSLIVSAGNPAALKAAKGRAVKILTGYIIILSAWVVVYTITSVLLKPEFNQILTK